MRVQLEQYNAYTEYDESVVSCLKPRDDYCLITPVVDENTSIIVRPDVVTVVPHKGMIHAVGPAVSSLFPGNVVMFNKFAGFETTLGRYTYLFIRVTDIPAVVTPTGG